MYASSSNSRYMEVTKFPLPWEPCILTYQDNHIWWIWETEDIFRVLFVFISVKLFPSATPWSLDLTSTPSSSTIVLWKDWSRPGSRILFSTEVRQSDHAGRRSLQVHVDMFHRPITDDSLGCWLHPRKWSLAVLGCWILWSCLFVEVGIVTSLHPQSKTLFQAGLLLWKLTKRS